ncbi:MAG: DsbA family oxidoreductase [Rhizobiaceae bacterium]
MTSDKNNTLQIDIVSDVMCPWCFVGKRNFEAALPLIDDIELNISWRPYQLDATLPKEGKDRKLYLSDKFGGEERAAEIYKRIEDAGHSVGINFKFNDIKVSPNTLDAHRLIRWAGGQSAEMQDKVVLRLFELYFLEGENIGDHDVLVGAAELAGMDGKLVRDLLSSPEDVEAVEAEIATAQKMGVTGVPCFIIDQKYAVSGAQSADILAKAIRHAAAEKQEEKEYKGQDGM